MAGYLKKKITKYFQMAATPKLHPRSLARSVGKTIGAADAWRKEVAKLPRTGQKYLHPERHRTEKKVSGARESSAVR